MKPQEKVVPEPRGRKAVSPAVFRVKEQAVTAAGARPKRANMGGTAGSVPRPVAKVFSLRFFYVLRPVSAPKIPKRLLK